MTKSGFESDLDGYSPAYLWYNSYSNLVYMVLSFFNVKGLSNDFNFDCLFALKYILLRLWS